MSAFNNQMACDGVLYGLKCYRDQARVRRDVGDLLSSYSALRPSASPAPTGGVPVMNLAGTVPILYQGTRYNIPVRLWIPEAYPYRPPLVYVTPTPEMSIVRGHQHVDPAGMVYHPYLSTWNPASHSLLGMMQSVCQVFGIQPPLYATRSSAHQQQSPSQSPSPPAASPYQQMPAGYNPSPASGGNSITSSPSSSPYPYGPGSSPYGTASQGPYGGSGGQQLQGPYGPVSQGPYGMASQGPFGIPAHRPPPPPPEDPAVVEKRQKRSEVVAKFRTKLGDFLDPAKNGTDEQQKENAAIAEESRKRKSQLSGLEQELAALTAEAASLKKKIDDATKFIEEADAKGPIDVDTSSDPVDIHRRQLIRTVAIDMALEDVLYNLDRALLKGVVPLDEYLKLFRLYSNEQFFARALIKKIREIIVFSSQIPH